MSLDTELYLVMCRHTGGDYFPEQNFADATSKATLIKDIRDGQYDAIGRVLYLCPAEGISRDVSEDIAREIIAAIDSDLAAGKHNPRPYAELADWLELQTGETVQAAPEPARFYNPSRDLGTLNHFQQGVRA